MSQDSQEAIASYITDMMAVEEHLQKAFSGQLADIKHARFASVISELNTTSERHLKVLRALAERREQGGQGISEVVKRAASGVLGIGAAAIDLVRTEKLPKNLRDDYTAVCLANIGYLMLHTTAEALNDAEVAEVAHTHLRDYAQASMTLFNVVPHAVVDFLAEEGFAVDQGAAARINSNIENVWESGATHGV